MQTAKSIFKRTLFHYLLQDFLVKYRFKFVLPRIHEINLEGMRFDVSLLSTRIRNRLLSGEYEAHERQMCSDFLDENDSVVEIGAAIGFIGLYCQKRLGIKNYSCFEANPRTYEILRRNYELNGVEPRVWNMALAHADGTVDLEVGTDFWENSICYNVNTTGEVQTVNVPAGTLNTLLDTAGHPVNVLIIDIEGAEQFVDFTQIPESVNKIIMELHPGVIGQEITYNIIATLIGMGFRVAREEKGSFTFLRK